MTEKFTSHKHMSKSTPGWSHSSTTPLQKSTHSRNQSVNSRQIYPAPLNPQKVPMPAPLRPQKSKSPIPFSRLNDHSEPMRTRNSPIPFSDLFNKSPKKPPSEKSDDGTFLPATKYSPPPPIPPIPPILPEPSITAHPRRPSGPPTGLVSWERVAIQNARIRATQGTSPSPVSPLTQVRVVPIPRSPDFAREGYPFRVGTPRQPEPPRRRGTPGAGEALRQALSSPLSPLRSSTPDPDDGKLVRGSGSGSGGVMRKGSRRSEKARKEVRWSKDVDYEG